MPRINANAKRRWTFAQQENEVIEYVVNWASVLDGGTVSTSTWTAPNGGITFSGETNDTSTSQATITGSETGKHLAVNKITESGGQTFEVVALIHVQVNDSSTSSTDYGL